jgi:hypothetical protein
VKSEVGGFGVLGVLYYGRGGRGVWYRRSWAIGREQVMEGGRVEKIHIQAHNDTICARPSASGRVKSASAQVHTAKRARRRSRGSCFRGDTALFTADSGNVDRIHASERSTSGKGFGVLRAVEKIRFEARRGYVVRSAIGQRRAWAYYEGRAN